MNEQHQQAAQDVRAELHQLAQACRGILEGLNTLDQKWEAWEAAGQAKRESLEAQVMHLAAEPVQNFVQKVVYLYDLEESEEGDYGPEGDFDPDWRPAA